MRARDRLKIKTTIRMLVSRTRANPRVGLSGFGERDRNFERLSIIRQSPIAREPDRVIAQLAFPSRGTHRGTRESRIHCPRRESRPRRRIQWLVGFDHRMRYGRTDSNYRNYGASTRGNPEAGTVPPRENRRAERESRARKMRHEATPSSLPLPSSEILRSEGWRE